ncbi:MAG TPA: sulfurtransferase [Candidatus Dormibacteraeota bacterium]|nr:sulfurtransferase [Candidatus Dormibacteraeota bacterium]
MSMSFGPLIDAAWLAEHVNDPHLRVIDVRWYLDGRSGRAAYEGGHIPGAVFVDLAGVSGHEPGRGRHPLPDRAGFEQAMRQAGVGRDTAVVAYDDAGGTVAARLWWMLRYFGHERAGVLNGGINAWPGQLEADTTRPAPGDFTAAAPRTDLKLDYDDVRALPAGTLLLDARVRERYRGDAEPVDARPGHIPGARSAPAVDNLTADKRMRSPEELRRRYEGLGVADPANVVVYCGSGVSACHDLLALEVAGLPGARLYPGSWSEWASHPDAPAATGDE